MGNTNRCARSTLMTARSGFSLVEMLVAILLTAIIVTATFSALLLTKADLSSSDNQMSVSQAQQQLLQTLQNYQAASISLTDANSGPNQGGTNSWSLPTDTGAPCSGTNCPAQCQSGATLTGCPSALAGCDSNSYALQICCIHNVTTMLPTALQNSPYNGIMCYTVTDQSGNNGAQATLMPQVNVMVQWTKQTP